MPLQMTVDSLEGVPTEHQGLYKANETGDGFSLDISGTQPAAKPPAPANPPPPSTVIETVPAGVKKKLEEYDRLKAEEQARSDKKLADAGQFDKLKLQMEERHQAEVNKLTKDYNDLKSEYHGGIVKNDATNAFLTAGGNPEMVEVILPHIMNKLQFKDGATVAVDAQGNTLMTAEAGQSGFMGAAEVLTGMKADNKFMSLFQGTKASGSGQNPPPPASIGQVSKKSDLSPSDVVAYVEKYGEEKYLSLPA